MSFFAQKRHHNIAANSSRGNPVFDETLLIACFTAETDI
jgi:hypothetical protein